MIPELAIVIPAYKSTFLRETLESIARQTDKRFNLYIGDDCSPHDIKSIIDEFQNRIPSLTYHRFDSNLGGKDLVGQWERCIALTQDESYLWLFSDDDTMSPTCVEAFYNHIDANPSSDMMRLDVTIINADSSPLRDVSFPRHISSKELYINKLTGKNECYVVEYIFSREIYKKVNGFEKFDLAWGSDLATWVKMGHNGGINTINGGKVMWRSSGINISTTQSPQIMERKALALADFLNWGDQEFGYDAEVVRTNIRGFLSRISNMGLESGIAVGFHAISRYHPPKTNRLLLRMKYVLLYSLKRLKHVF